MLCTQPHIRISVVVVKILDKVDFNKCFKNDNKCYNKHFLSNFSKNLKKTSDSLTNFKCLKKERNHSFKEKWKLHERAIHITKSAWEKILDYDSPWWPLAV